jgi:hypothetical protein
VDVVAGFGEDDVVFAFFAEGGGETDIEFVGLAFGGGGLGVKAESVTRLDALDEGAEDGVEMGDILHVEDFAAGLVDDFADVDEAGNHAGGEESGRRIVEHGVGSDGFGDDIARTLAAGVGADVVADENDDAATVGRKREEIAGGEKDAVVDVGGAAGVESIYLVGDGRFVLGEGDAELSFGGEREERDLIVRLEGGESGVGGVAQRAEERTDGVAEVENESDVERKFVAAEDVDFLGSAVFAELEIFLFEIGHDLAGFGFDGGVEEDEVDADADGGLGFFLGAGGDLKRESEREEGQRAEERDGSARIAARHKSIVRECGGMQRGVPGLQRKRANRILC